MAPQQEQVDALRRFVAETANEHDIPGASVAVLHEGRELYASHGVTNLRHPMPVDERTLFHLASVTKTFTATAVLRLVAEGRLDLDVPVRRYLPELALADESAAASITLAQLLNHTSGLDWNLVDEEGDSLAEFVEQLSRLEMIGPPGARASYSQAGYNLVGRVLERVTGQTYEEAIASLVLRPAGLDDTVFDLDDILIRGFAVGHNPDANGTPLPARPWRAWRAGARGNYPGGGIVSSASDLIRWARFHLGAGDGVLPGEWLRRMREPTVELRSSSLGDAFGICWFLRDVDGVRTVGHGGSGNGQFAELLLVPERDFAVVSLSNAGPGGVPFNQAVLRWTLSHFLEVIDRDPEPVPYDRTRAEAVVGRYQNDAMYLDIATDGRRLTLAVDIRPEVRAASKVEMPPGYPAAEIGFLPGGGDEFIVTEGGMRGQRGFFGREGGGVDGGDGAVVSIDLAGRTLARASDG